MTTRAASVSNWLLFLAALGVSVLSVLATSSPTPMYLVIVTALAMLSPVALIVFVAQRFRKSRPSVYQHWTLLLSLLLAFGNWYTGHP